MEERLSSWLIVIVQNISKFDDLFIKLSHGNFCGRRFIQIRIILVFSLKDVDSDQLTVVTKRSRGVPRSDIERKRPDRVRIDGDLVAKLTLVNVWAIKVSSIELSKPFRSDVVFSDSEVSDLSAVRVIHRKGVGKFQLVIGIKFYELDCGVYWPLHELHMVVWTSWNPTAYLDQGSNV